MFKEIDMGVPSISSNFKTFKAGNVFYFGEFVRTDCKSALA